MDQLKFVLSAIKKHHFWILCGLILIAYLAVWFRSTSGMTQQAATRATAISTAFSTGEKIAGIQNHPNTQSADMMKALNRAEAEQVRLAWESRFREQEDVLVWPEELLPDFIAAVEPLKPIELKVDFPTPATQELKMEFRNRYRDYIRRELPKLAEIIGAEWRVGQQAGMGGMGGMGAMGGMMGPMMGMAGPGGMPPGLGPTQDLSGGTAGYPGGPTGGSPYGGMMGPYGRGLTGEENPIVVEWASTSQSEIQASSFNWTSPTTLQVLYAQEDLWVLRALMLVIKATNGDAEAQYQAAIKELMSLQLGRMAGGLKDGGMSAGGMGSMMPMGGMMAMSSAMMGGAMASSAAPMMGGPSGGPPSSGSSAGGAPSEGGGMSPYAGMSGSGDPADNRYVDDNTEPLTGDRLRTAMKSDQPADAFLAVAKRMPVRMRVRMNVLRLPLFLSEFAKSNLPVEVRQVRINPSATGGAMGGAMGMGSKLAGGGMAAGPMGMPPGMMTAGPGAGMTGPPGMGGMMSAGPMPMGEGGSPTGMMMGAMGGMGPGASMGGMPRSGMSALGGDSPYDAVVEIYGLIYIYNPVNPTKLGLDTAVAQSPANGAAAGGTTDAATAPASDAAAAQDLPADADESVPASTGISVPPAAEGADAASTPPAAEPAGGAPAADADTRPAATPESGAATADTASPPPAPTTPAPTDDTNDASPVPENTTPGGSP
ncbi:MAG: hypothetical protein MUF48_05610 [Pirellulaceae bacterium]|jgi:hypothetical protein|nr:hypothetical protein [Pirellulaceae bacterium]